MKDHPKQRNAPGQSRMARRRARVRAELLLPALQVAKDQGQLATYDPVLLARLIMSMIIQAITWWLEYDEPGPDVMAEHILYLLGRGLPAWLLA